LPTPAALRRRSIQPGRVILRFIRANFHEIVVRA
jgi:hypothetical protein